MELRMKYSLLLVALFINGVTPKTALVDPPSRSSMWRFGFDTPPNYNDHELSCGGHERMWSKNGGRCGECGDPYDLPQPRDNEAGGLYGKSQLSRVFREGEIMNVVVHMEENKGGWFEFRICENDNPKRFVKQSCLNKNVLKMVDYPGDRYYVKELDRGLVAVRLQLPKGLECRHCVLQFHHTSSSENGKKFCLENKKEDNCNLPTVYRGCSDIAIFDNERDYLRFNNLTGSINLEKIIRPSSFEGNSRKISGGTSKGGLGSTKSDIYPDILGPNRVAKETNVPIISNIGKSNSNGLSKHKLEDLAMKALKTIVKSGKIMEKAVPLSKKRETKRYDQPATLSQTSSQNRQNVNSFFEDEEHSILQHLSQIIRLLIVLAASARNPQEMETLLEQVAQSLSFAINSHFENPSERKFLDLDSVEKTLHNSGPNQNLRPLPIQEHNNNQFEHNSNQFNANNNQFNKNDNQFNRNNQFNNDIQFPRNNNKFNNDNQFNNNNFFRSDSQFNNNNKQFNNNGNQFNKNDNQFNRNNHFNGDDNQFNTNGKQFDRKSKQFDSNSNHFGQRSPPAKLKAPPSASNQRSFASFNNDQPNSRFKPGTQQAQSYNRQSIEPQRFTNSRPFESTKATAFQDLRKAVDVQKTNFKVISNGPKELGQNPRPHQASGRHDDLLGQLPNLGELLHSQNPDGTNKDGQPYVLVLLSSDDN